MTKKKTTPVTPTELTEAATDKVRGGAEWKLTNVWVSSVKDEPKTNVILQGDDGSEVMR